MNIAIFLCRDIKNPLSGGSEIYFHELAKNWVKSGNKVTWFSSTFKDCKKREEIDGIDFIRCGGEVGVYTGAFLSYLKFRKNIDLIIDVDNGIPFFTPLYSRKKKFLHIHHVHNDIWFKEVKFPFSWIGWFLEMKMIPLIYRKTPLITLSESSADDIIKYGLSKEKPDIVNPGIEFCKIKKLKKLKKPALLFVNRIKRYKGMDILLEAVKELNSKGFDFELWIAGKGDYLDEARDYVKKNQLRNVRFFGFVSEEKKRNLMQTASIFVNPSSKEGWGIVNIEANYFGLPVIGSNISGIKDSVVEGKTGLLFNPGDSVDFASKIKFLLENPSVLKKMSKQSKVWAKNFSYDIKAKEYLDVLKKKMNKID